MIRAFRASWARRAALVGVMGGAALGIAAAASAQRVEPGRPRTVIVGASRALAPTDRVDARRSGFSRTRLPASGLRTSFRHAFEQVIEHAPLVLDDGSIAVVVNRNELVLLAGDRTPKYVGLLGGGALGPLTALSDGTIVAVNSAGEALGVRHGTVRFRTRLGGERSLAGRVSPLSLEDGGVVVATSTELAALDAEGSVRARASVPEPLATPLLAARGQVLAVSATGAVYGWIPGREAQKIGTFGAPIDGSAVLGGPSTLLAVVEGTRLAAMDLAHGTVVTRSSVQAGVYLGPPALQGEVAHLLSMSPGRTLLVAIDGAGQELARHPVSTFAPMALSDGGQLALVAPTHSGVLVDGAGTVAFATPEGFIGVASANTGVRLLGETPWATRITAAGKPRSGNIVGMAPTRDGFVVVSDTGNLVEVVGAEAAGR
ncbi:hypothetical protein [Pendulispora albinea]|uniref:PQQ-like beta-propeller repeat protein n=1 Tax=Pendulispora albinea TaxID=2741071 RepID=A0ABZ2M6K8_9BACT